MVVGGQRVFPDGHVLTAGGWSSPGPDVVPGVGALRRRGFEVLTDIAGPLWAGLPEVWPPALVASVPETRPDQLDMEPEEGGGPVLWLAASPWPSLTVADVLDCASRRMHELGRDETDPDAPRAALTDLLGWTEDQLWAWWLTPRTPDDTWDGDDSDGWEDDQNDGVDDEDPRPAADRTPAAGDRVPVVDPEAAVAAAWRAAGVDPLDSAWIRARDLPYPRLDPALWGRWAAAGVDRWTTAAWLDAPSVLEPTDRGRWLGVVPDHAEAAAWARAVPDPAAAAHWRGLGADPDAARWAAHAPELPGWQQAGFEVRDAHRLTGGGLAVTAAAAYRATGFDVAGSGCWGSRGFTAAEAAQWIAAGFGAAAARQWADADWPPDAARAAYPDADYVRPWRPPGDHAVYGFIAAPKLPLHPDENAPGGGPG